MPRASLLDNRAGLRNLYVPALYRRTPRSCDIVALAFGAALLAAAIISILRTLGQHMSVEIDGNAISIPQVARVDLSMTFSSATTRIALLCPEDVEKFVRCRQWTFSSSETFSMAAFLRGLSKIDVTALPSVDRIALAEALREAVAHDRGGPDPIR